ncbi:uncharacterized protein LOC121367316 [Gigantopelta aegis]|uniref:uncharacterized protein LOC121367316 n=1 Tax=Gigantopelta aegis TaxID=1735272 RepID=UPI001B88C4CD|nr:uncharacterized protein LOC121367316 [Gigantopelta aegis]
MSQSLDLCVLVCVILAPAMSNSYQGFSIHGNKPQGVPEGTFFPPGIEGYPDVFPGEGKKVYTDPIIFGYHSRYRRSLDGYVNGFTGYNTWGDKYGYQPPFHDHIFDSYQYWLQQ